MKIRCLKRVRDKHGRITGYILQNEDGRQASVDAVKMKQLLSTGAVVENLKLTSDNRIIYMETAQAVPDDKTSRILIDSNVLNELKVPKNIVPVYAVQKQVNNIKEYNILKANIDRANNKDISAISLGELLSVSGVKLKYLNNKDTLSLPLSDFMLKLDKYLDSTQHNNSKSDDISNSDFLAELGLGKTLGKKVYLQRDTLKDIDNKLYAQSPHAVLDDGKLYPDKRRETHTHKLIIKSGVSSSILKQAKNNKSLIGTYQNGDIYCIKVSNCIVLASPHRICMPKDSYRHFYNSFLYMFNDIDIRDLDTSEVTNMRSAFADMARGTTLDLHGLDTSNVTDMCLAFSGGLFDSSEKNPEVEYIWYSDFDQGTGLKLKGLNELDTKNVTNMKGAFAAVDFGENYLWLNDTSSVTNMQGMFIRVTCDGVFDLSRMDTHNVTNMSDMFDNAIFETLNLGHMDISSLTDARYMFSYLNTKSVLDLSGLDTKNINGMQGMFCCANLEQGLNLSRFNTSNVEDMSCMFQEFNICIWEERFDPNIKLDLRSFDTRNVKDMESMFAACRVNKLDLSSFDTRNVKTMKEMFYSLGHDFSDSDIDITNTKLDLRNFDTRNVEDMSGMFKGCGIEEIDISSFDTRKVVNADEMFKDCKASIIKIGPGWTLPDSVFEGCNAKIVRC